MLQQQILQPGVSTKVNFVSDKDNSLVPFMVNGTISADRQTDREITKKLRKAKCKENSQPKGKS